MKNFVGCLAVCCSTLVLGAVAAAQDDIISTERTVYRSEEDRLLTIKRISVLPMLDNVGGIYSRPLEKHLIEIVKKDHHWDYIELNLAGPLLTPEELESNPEKVQSLSAGLEADAILAARLTKGPNGITIKMNMFSTKDYKLFANAEKKNFNRFEINELQGQVAELFKDIVKKIPYEGLVLSRQNNRVTVNLGSRDGIEEGQVVSVVQIIKVNRHPKFNFIINAEKEVLGKIKLLKIDDSLSFGKIITEKEKGVISKDSKISGIDFVKYGATESLTDNTATEDELLKRPDGLISFGKNATAWLPKKPPTFGMVGAAIGNSLYSYNVQRTEGLNASSIFNPFVALSLELWVTSQWTVHAGIRQGILSIKNPSSSSTPEDLSAAMSFYELLMGYKFRLSPTVWGPQVEILGGLANYDLKVDDSSPRTLTSTKYSGIKTGLSGSYPLDKEENWAIGANLFFFFQPNLSESPSPSGAGAESAINQFGFFTYMKLAMNLRAQASLDFELFKTNYAAGSSATSSSQKYTSVNAGLFYMF